MKGLFLKDIYALMSLYKKNLPTVFVVYFILAFAMELPFFFYMVIWLMGFYSLSAIGLDQSCGWDRYARTLPVSDKQIVGGKFLVGLAFMGVGTLYSLAGGTLAILVRGGEAWEGFFEVNLVMIAFSLISVGTMIPAAYKWGLEKARNSFFLVYAAVFAGGIFLLTGDGHFLKKYLPGGAEAVLAALNGLFENIALLAAVSLAVSGAVYALGWKLAENIYAKKEF